VLNIVNSTHLPAPAAGRRLSKRDGLETSTEPPCNGPQPIPAKHLLYHACTMIVQIVSPQPTAAHSQRLQTALGGSRQRELHDDAQRCGAQHRQQHSPACPCCWNQNL
jgi:hypothetical protein